MTGGEEASAAESRGTCNPFASIIYTREEAFKVTVVTCFCFTSTQLLLLGRNIGATMLLTGLGAEALPYCMVFVGILVICAMPYFSAVATKFGAVKVLFWTALCMVVTLGVFFVIFVTGLAKRYPRVVYPLFFVVEEVIDSVLMVLFWQIAMLCFSTDEAKRLIGIVNMGAAVANLANGLTVSAARPNSWPYGHHRDLTATQQLLSRVMAKTCQLARCC